MDEKHSLTREAFIDAADVPTNTYPFNKIEFVGISSVSYTDVSIIQEAVNLRIVVFRLCGFSAVPVETFKLTLLQSIDLSGNAISMLPEAERWATLTELHTVNLSDNNITNLNEVFKLAAATNIRRLMLTGNICLAENGSFDTIVTKFPRLQLLNDQIITSQHRAYIAGDALFDNNALLPMSKIDHFFFLYVKYMHTASHERYVKKVNAELFCLNRVIRRSSAAEKIQSVWKGSRQKAIWTVEKGAALFICARVRYWYMKRVKAATRIRSCFLYSKTRALIKRILAAKRIQSAWRKMVARREALAQLFVTGETFSICIKTSDLEAIEEFIDKMDLPAPDTISKTKYVILRESEPRRLTLPGSPTIYYNIDGSVIIRMRRKRKNIGAMGVWCGHDHMSSKPRVKSTKRGINWTRNCLFDAVKPRQKKYKPEKMFQTVKYEQLVQYGYSDCERVGQVVDMFIRKRVSMRIFSVQSLECAAAQTVVQASLKMFRVRMAGFREMKEEIIENRARVCLLRCITSERTWRITRHVSDMCKYARQVQRTQTLFVSNAVLEGTVNRHVKWPVEFGYSTERSVIVSPRVIGFLMNFIPSGRLIFALQDVPNLLKMGTSVMKAQVGMFHTQISPKYIKRYNVMRVSCPRIEEAMRRVILYAWLTGNFTDVMTEDGVVRFCAAITIQSMWRGAMVRKTIHHLYARDGIIKTRSKKRTKKESANENVETDAGHEVIIKEKDLRRKASDVIHHIRNDYRPWAEELDEFKFTKSREAKLPQPRASTSLEPPSESARNLGMITDVGDAGVKTISASEMGNYSWSLGPGFMDDDPRAQSPFLTESRQQKVRTNSVDGFSYEDSSGGYSGQSTRVDTAASGTDSVSIRRQRRHAASVMELTETQRAKQSSQVTNHEPVARARQVFTKLVRLHEIGKEIERTVIIADDIEEKLNAARQARQTMVKSRLALDYTKEKQLSDTVDRNRIEKENFIEDLQEQRERAAKQRRKRIQNMKEERQSKQQKLARDRKFGMAFVSVTRQVSEMAEKERVKNGRAQKFQSLRSTLTDVRATSIENRAAMRDKLTEIEHQKRRIAIIDRMITAGRGDMQNQHHMVRLSEIHEEKRKARERQLLSKMSHTKRKFFVPEPIVPIKADQVEIASNELEQNVGAHLGSLESRLLADIINDILIS